jgi:putative endonuclease
LKNQPLYNELDDNYSKQQTIMTHTELGKYGEDLAAKLLEEKGYQIKQRNFRFKKFEVDIVAEKDNQLIVCEVKTRETAVIGEPYLAVTKKKQRQIIETADYYVKLKNLWIDVRFDIVSIIHNSYRTNIEHIEDAFFPTV